MGLNLKLIGGTLVVLANAGLWLPLIVAPVVTGRLWIWGHPTDGPDKPPAVFDWLYPIYFVGAVSLVAGACLYYRGKDMESERERRATERGEST